MRGKTAFAFTMLAGIGVLGAGNMDEAGEETKRELIELVRIWDAASVSGDVKVLDRILAEEFTLLGVPKAEYLAAIQSRTMGIESAVSDHFDVRIHGDTAILIAEDTITLNRSGRSAVEVYRYIDVWVKREGRWQCVATESSPKQK